jgi:DNA-binding response OmpR family regulator
MLVLDADPEALLHAQEALREGGHRVVGTGDPEKAARLALSADVVLVDIALAVLEIVPRWQRRRTDPDAPDVRLVPPFGEGYAVLRSLEADPIAARFPVVFLRDGEATQARPPVRFGVVDYVSKPVTALQLNQRIGEVLNASGPSANEVWPSLPVEAAAPALEALPKALRTALLVDGDVEKRTALSELLARHGFSVFEAADGEEALKVAHARRPWLIITEVNMSGMDGFEFCRRVRSHALLRHTPLVFLSGWDDYRERYHGIKLGADEYLSKQTPARELLIRLQLVLKKYADLGTRTRKGPGMEGEIDLIGAPGMLQMCHLGRFSGICTVRSASGRAEIRLRDGEIVSASAGPLVGAEAVFEFLAWGRGHFEFVPGDPVDREPLPESFDFLLLEGCRRLDEGARRDGDGDPEDGEAQPEPRSVES